MNQNRYNEILKENEEIKKLTKLIKRLNSYVKWEYDVLNYNINEYYNCLFKEDISNYLEEKVEEINKKINRINKLLEKEEKE